MMATSSKLSVLHRCLSTSAIASQLAKVHGIEGRYATALYSAAVKQKKLDAVEGELRSVQKLLQEDVKFRDFVLDPTFKRTMKKDTIEAIAKKLGYSDISQNFFAAVAENGRMARLGGIIKSFEQIMSAHRGEVQCEVTTAKPLDANTEKELRAALQAFVKPGQNLHVRTHVDPTIIGGLIATIGDKYVDMSMSSKIQNYTNVIKEAI